LSGARQWDKRSLCWYRESWLCNDMPLKEQKLPELCDLALNPIIRQHYTTVASAADWCLTKTTRSTTHFQFQFWWRRQLRSQLYVILVVIINLFVYFVHATDRFHWPIQGPHALANTTPPNSRNVSAYSTSHNHMSAASWAAATDNTLQSVTAELCCRQPFRCNV